MPAWRTEAGPTVAEVATFPGGAARLRGGRAAIGRCSGGWVLPAASALIGALFAVPAAFVVWRTIRLDASFVDTWSDIPGPLWRTVQLATLVSLTAAALGTVLAWTTTRTDLPLQRMWRLVLALPLVLPSFVGASAFIAGLAPGGVIHGLLDAVGIDAPRRFRGLGASWFVLSVFTYPYVFLPVSARLANLRAGHEESARMLGCTQRQAFVRVTLPELRPAILGGALLVYLYTLSEFGAVQLLGYDTLTRVIFASRLSDRALSFASATALLAAAVVVVVAERRLRGRSPSGRGAVASAGRQTELGWWKVPATLTCAAVAGFGLIIPVSSLAIWAQRGIADGRVGVGDLVEPTLNTATVAIVTAFVTVLVVMPIALATSRRPGVTSGVAAGSVLSGFAIPGLVSALALAVIALNAPWLGFLYQTLPLLIIAYVVHFGSQALASSEQAVRAVPDAVREQSRLLESNPLRRTFLITLPLMRPGLTAGGGLVMLATLKELPATLLLAPNGYSTLATEVWSGLEEGFYAATGLASLVLIFVSGMLTWLLVLRRSEARTR